MTQLLPLEVHGGPHEFGGDPFSMLPLLGSFLVLVLLAALAGFYLWRNGMPSLPALGRSQPPEDEAKRILAGRFANGEITSEDFMERASILNWTPGSEAVLYGRPRRRGPRSRR